MLWDLPQRIDWCKVKDIEVFGMLKSTTDTDNSAIQLLFPDYRIEHMQLMQFQEKDSDKPQLCLYDSENNFILKESIICHFIIIGIAPSIPPFPLFPLV